MPETPFHHRSPEGAEVLVEPLSHAKSCAVGFWVRRGSRHERPEEEGLAHFLEHTVFKGTARYPTPDHVAELTDHLGGHVDAFTGKELACFSGRVLKEQLDELLELLGSLVTEPLFDPAELGRERGVILEEIAMSEDTPDDWVSELFYDRFWAGSTLSHSILGRREQVQSYGPEAARAFFEATYRAPNLVIVATGAVEPRAFLEKVAPILARLPKGPTPHPDPAPAATAPFLLNVPRRDLQQANLLMGFPAPPHLHPDRAAVGILSHVLGGGMSSRLFMELRERRGLCYQVGSFTAHYEDTGALQIGASCAPAQARELVQRALEECQRIRSGGITEAELDRARRHALTSLAFGQESASSRMYALATQAISWGELRSYERLKGELEAVGVEDVRRAAETWLDPARLGLAALGTTKSSAIRVRDVLP